MMQKYILNRSSNGLGNTKQLSAYIFSLLQQGKRKLKVITLMVCLSLLVLSPVNAESWQSKFVETYGASIVTVLPQTGRADRNLAEPEGTGIIIKPGNLVLTASHVLGRTNRILLRKHDGSVIDAKLYVRDIGSDLALLKIEENLAALEFETKAHLGEQVCAYGNAFGLGMSLSCGIISATDKRGIGFNRIEDFIQTDAAINPGMSGAPLFNRNGKITGMLSAIFTKKSDGNLGVNFAASTRLIRAFLKDAEDGTITPIRAGMVMRPAPERGTIGRAGAKIMKIADNSAEQKAGLIEGDLVIKAANLDVRGQADYLAALALNQQRDTIDIKLIRDNKEKSITLKLNTQQ